MTDELTPAERFFYDNSVNWGHETYNEARLRTAREMAAAEQHAKDHNWRVEWCDDWEVNHGDESGYDPVTCEYATLYTEGDEALASLSCIDDADANYRRVIEAELAQEAIDYLRREGKL